MDLAQAVFVGLMVAAAILAAHFGLTWMGRRGWIFYGSTGSSAPLGSRTAMALMEFDTLVNPAVEHVIEYRRHGDLWIEETGEPS